MGRGTTRERTNRQKNSVIWMLAMWALVASSFVVLGPVTPSLSTAWNLFGQPSAQPAARPHKRNVIFMVSDGMGPASLSLTRSYRQYVEELPYDDLLVLDKHFIGNSRTRSSNSLITDSAAGATAFSCSQKSYNGAISVLPNGQACGTILESAKLNGYKTGLVVTTRITDATPACFSSHADHRSEEDLIAEHQLGGYELGRMVDLMIGGGRCHFLPKGHKDGCRSDSRNLVQEAQHDGWSYAGDLEAFKQLDGGNNVSLPLLSLLSPGDIPFDLDRDDKQYPSLEQTAKTALRALERATKDSDKGFFLLIEGSRIDHAGHANDAAAQVREVLAYDRAFNAALEFAKESDAETVVLSTSDHETGGLATARQLTPDYPEYLWEPQALHNATHSGEYLAHKLKSYDGDNVEKFIKTEIVEQGLGIVDATDDEIATLAKAKSGAGDYLVDMVSKRSQTGWSTHGHSAVDVNVYGFGGNKHAHRSVLDKLAKSNENTEMGTFMADYLGLDLGAVTKKLKGIKTSRYNAQSVDAYH